MTAATSTTAEPSATAETPAFAGATKKGQSILGPPERRFIDWAIPKVLVRSSAII